METEMVNLQKRQRDRDDELAKETMETEMILLQKRQRDRDNELTKETERQR